MNGAYWGHGQGRERPAAHQPYEAKRPRLSYEIPSVSDVSSYYARESDRAGFRIARDINSINPLYGFTQISPGLGGHHHVADPRAITMGGSDLLMAARGASTGVGGRHEIPPSHTLYVEGLPANCSRREVSHVFRPFLGYKEVRIVTKDSRHSGGERLVLCFVDFESPAHAATAMNALQGYKFDEHERDSAYLRLQFARYPGVRAEGSHRGKC